jgi:protein tyrosine phosphatase/predicted NAD-dependent protein-ADP-ribosyltransferase YbiA (DUF1768 family)
MVDLKSAKNCSLKPTDDTIVRLMLNKYNLENIYNEINRLTISTEDLTTAESSLNIYNKHIEVCSLSNQDLETIKSAYTIFLTKTEKYFTKFPLQNDPVDIIGLASKATKQKHLLFGKESSHPQLACLALDFPCEIEFKGIKYPSALHAFMAQTFENHPALQKQCAQVSIEDLIQLVLKQGNPNHDHWYRISSDSDSKQYREEVLCTILRAKFDQHPELKKILLATLSTHLIYRSGVNKQDDFWGTGAYRKNLNKLGEALMELREQYIGTSGNIFLKTLKPQLLDKPHKTGIPALDKSEEEIAQEIAALNKGIKEEDYKLQTATCREEANLAKNRCHGVNYVYDATLVHLKTGNYINANWLHGTLIGTQAPMANTVKDFLDLILERKSPAIVMLSRPFDVEVVYFPDSIQELKEFGEIEVKLVEKPIVTGDPSWNQFPFEEELHGYVERVLEIKKGTTTHRTTHYQYLNWRDRQIGSEECIAHLVRELHEKYADNPLPIVVHCSAGVGRTGTFTAIQDQYGKWKKGGEINIPACIAQQRSPKTGRYPLMTSSPLQYQFCYHVLRALVRSEM